MPNGGLAWIEKKHLSDQRTRSSLPPIAPRCGRKPTTRRRWFLKPRRSVALDYVESRPRAAGLKVRHRDGQAGFVRANQVWGF